MKKFLLVALVLIQASQLAIAQTRETGPGIALYPTGTETGIGYRSAKDTRWAADIRVTKANVLNNSSQGSIVNEASAIYRLVYLEKVRFHIGLGARADWNFATNDVNKFGGVMPIGVEAFPFPFQNAGLFFEAAPYYTVGTNDKWNSGIRTVAGFLFYFPVKNKKKDETN